MCFGLREVLLGCFCAPNNLQQPRVKFREKVAPRECATPHPDVCFPLICSLLTDYQELYPSYTVYLCTVSMGMVSTGMRASTPKSFNRDRHH